MNQDDPTATESGGVTAAAAECDPLSARPPSRLRRVAGAVRHIGFILATAYLLVTVGMMFLEEWLIFVPTRYPGGDWNPDGLAVRDVEFRAADNVRLHGWYCPVSEPRAVVLYSHGNGGNLTHRADEIQLWQNYLGVSVFIYDYRGYGRSDGRPNEPGVYADARAAYRCLTEKLSVPPDQIVLHGESLGCAVSVQLALEVPHKAMTLQSPFTSAVDIGARHYPWLPVRWVMRNRFESMAKIGQYRGPLLVIHGTHDSIVPFDMGQTLFEHANEPKRFYAVRGADHNDVSFVGGREYFETIGEFLDGLGQ